MASNNVLDFFRLVDRAAIVTGGSRGLGKQIAAALAGAGADIVLCSGHEDASQSAAEEIRAQTGRRVIGVAADVTKESDANGLIDTAMKTFGRVDILVNNAGINIRRPSSHSWDSDIHVF